MTKWPTVELGSLCTRIGDGLHGTPEYSTGTRYYFINGNNLDGGQIKIYPETKEVSESEYRRNYIELTENSLLLSINGTLGNMAFYRNEQIMLGKSSAYLNFKTDINKFYYYYFQLPGVQKHFYSIATGSTIKNLSLDSLKSFVVPVPEQDEYRKIAKVLSVLDDKIELNRRINAELEQMARTLYDYWFVQFDFPDTNGKPYKSSGGQMIYSDQLKREIPAGWKVQDMYNNDLFDIIKPKIDKFAGEKQYIATADVDGLNISKGSPITYENRESRANMQPKEYTVWFAKMKASIKHILVGDYSKDLLQDAIFSTGFMGIQTSKEAFEYVALTVHRPYFELVKDANSNGATMAAIGNNDMKNIKLLVPSPDVITSFHEAVRPILQKIDQNRQESQKLAELRDWLLPMLMNGQVKVEDTAQLIKFS